MKRFLKWGLLVLLVVAFLWGPYFVWLFLPTHPLSVVVVDKTVPFRKYREHSALMWLLRALRIPQRDGKYLDASRNYVGYSPVFRLGTDLEERHLERADVLFIADTYGVYRGDYEKPGDIAALERSPKIYGGFSSAEAGIIEQFAAGGGMVIGEFNTFASPTEKEARALLEQLFGVRWTKWVARYWPNLQDPNEVPKWVGQVYTHVYGRPFDLTGGGLVFVHEDEDMVVLQDSLDVHPTVMSQERTARGAAVEGFPESGGYAYWLDVVEDRGAEIYYEHVVHVTESGAQKLSTHKIPVRFPALTRKRGRVAAWYFAGDFVDTGVELGDPERAGLLSFRKFTRGRREDATLDESFFWGFYAPILERLLLARAHDKPL